MKKIIQVRISKGENQYVAECLDLPDLAELDLAENPSVLASFELDPLVHAKA
jgi:hypothetical protein